jgi:hypothetical protein
MQQQSSAEPQVYILFTAAIRADWSARRKRAVQRRRSARRSARQEGIMKRHAAVKIMVLAAAGLLCLSSAAAASVIRVKPDGNDGNNGSSWSSAKQHVQAAIDAAAAGDEVWVAAGTYCECDASRSIVLKSGVALYGGFAGQETSREQRDWRANETILDALQRNRVLVIEEGASSDTRVDGVTIQNGNSPETYGGGIRSPGGAPTIANCVVTGNWAPYSGGIDSWGPALIVNCVITRNRCRGAGGGVGLVEGTIRDCVVTENTADNSWGGGIYCYKATVLNNIIRGNWASNDHGGGIGTPGNDTIIANNVIAENTAAHWGGGIYTESWEIPPPRPLILNNTIVRNETDIGGGIYSRGSEPTIANNVVAGNVATNYGGGIYAEFTYNPGELLIANNTIVNNAAPDGGGVYTWIAVPAIANNIVAFNDAGGIRGAYESELAALLPSLCCNCVYGNGAYDYRGVTPGTGDISLDPLLANPAVGDYHLTANSPCIDAGNDSFVQSDWVDMDGQPRVIGAAPDIGADEFAPIWFLYRAQWLPPIKYIDQGYSYQMQDSSTLPIKLALTDWTGAFADMPSLHINVTDSSGNTIADFPRGALRIETGDDGVQYYLVNLKTRESGMQVGPTYTIRALINGDVQVGCTVDLVLTSGGQAKGK